MTFPNRANYVPGQMRRERRYPVQAQSAMPDDTLKLQQELLAALADMPKIQSKEVALEQLDMAEKSLLEDPMFDCDEMRNHFLTFSALGVDVAASEAAVFAPQFQSTPHHPTETPHPPVLEDFRMAFDMMPDPLVKKNYGQAWQNLVKFASTKAAPRQPATGAIPASNSALLAAFDTSQQRGPKKRTNLSKEAKTVLRQWFEDHLHHPYPSEEEKEWLGTQGGITIEQVNNWFINTRGRKWKPMLTRLMADKEAGNCKLFDQMVQRIEEPYRRSPTQRK
ncbi:TPA: hypothetical protein N0F65_004165 [Lagenidium giganteum]|uniref:Homeobox domain-containing protein n=1 Tax=Lagenidium giganteum TaxID=4803 RepID=A0AAV2Z8J5_9STRA|nr:TPA: hypothetical protein N0F65_004165 [Lagenidium giganteum]